MCYRKIHHRILQKIQCRLNRYVLFPRMFDYKFAKAPDIVWGIKSKMKDNTVNTTTNSNINDARRLKRIHEIIAKV